MKKLFLTLGLLTVRLLAGLQTIFFGDPQAQVERQFQDDLPQLIQAAQALLSGEEVQPPRGWRDAEVFGDVVCFDYGGYGFGSSTSYWGISYVPGDYPVGFQGTRLDGAVPEGDGWLWSELEGDNRCYVERLSPCWYYYKMDF